MNHSSSRIGVNRLNFHEYFSRGTINHIAWNHKNLRMRGLFGKILSKKFKMQINKIKCASSDRIQSKFCSEFIIKTKNVRVKESIRNWIRLIFRRKLLADNISRKKKKIWPQYPWIIFVLVSFKESTKTAIHYLLSKLLKLLWDKCHKLSQKNTQKLVLWVFLSILIFFFRILFRNFYLKSVEKFGDLLEFPISLSSKYLFYI